MWMHRLLIFTSASHGALSPTIKSQGKGLVMSHFEGSGLHFKSISPKTHKNIITKSDTNLKYDNKAMNMAVPTQTVGRVSSSAVGTIDYYTSKLDMNTNAHNHVFKKAQDNYCAAMSKSRGIRCGGRKKKTLKFKKK